MKKEISLAEAAQELQLSKTTISRALSGKGRIGKETQDRIARFLEEQNAVVKTRSGMEKSKNIAILFPSHAIVAETPFFQNCLDGVYAYCSQKGYDLFYVSEKNDDLSKLEQLLDRKKVDGFILTHYQLGNNLIQYLQMKKVPFVLIGSIDDDSVIQVDSDHKAAGIELASMLLRNGEKNIALLSADSNNMVNRYRCEGFLGVICQKGSSNNQELFFQNVDGPMELDRAVLKIVDNKADCAVCTDDALCKKLVRKLQEYGCRIPEEIRVASMHDSIHMEMNNPPITAIRVDGHQLGSIAAKVLIGMLEGKKMPIKSCANYEIRLRQSTKRKKEKLI